jgi:CBS domain containing-hemolysin-like protein
VSAYVGLLALFLLTAATGYFVAQEFAFVAADRGVLREQAAAGDVAAEKALRVTSRRSASRSRRCWSVFWPSPPSR